MSTRIGVVSFAATAFVVQAPTHSREDIIAAIDRLQLQRGTAVGSGLLVSLKTTSEIIRAKYRWIEIGTVLVLVALPQWAAVLRTTH